MDVVQDDASRRQKNRPHRGAGSAYHRPLALVDPLACEQHADVGILGGDAFFTLADATVLRADTHCEVINAPADLVVRGINPLRQGRFQAVNAVDEERDDGGLTGRHNYLSAVSSKPSLAAIAARSAFANGMYLPASFMPMAIIDPDRGVTSALVRP